MKNRLPNLFFFLFTLLGLSSTAFAQAGKAFVIELRDEVHASSARHISSGFKAAEAAHASLVIIHLDTYGGRVDYADSIRADILNAPMPTAVFIDRNAGSAGALISIACDSIYMAPGASIGAATVVNGGSHEAAPDKYQSYWRGVMRSTAEIKGRDPKIAEKMVDQDLDLPGISPAGKVITFSVQEAMQYNYCDGEVQTLKEVAAAMGQPEAEIVIYQDSFLDLAINFLLRPAVSSVLLILIFGGIFLEIKTPGFGFGGIVAIAGIALFFAPHYIEGLAEVWEMVLFGVGVVLILLEVFVIPGFGVAGILGFILTVLGIGAALLANEGTHFDRVTLGDFLGSVAMVLVMMVSAILLVIVVVKYLVSSKAAYPYVDQNTQSKEFGYTALDNRFNQLVGKEADALTDLRPAGHISVNGEQFDAEAEEGYIVKGQKVMIVKVRSTNLIVKIA
jgi:membrane-bound serine protease (ClpP class)